MRYLVDFWLPLKLHKISCYFRLRPQNTLTNQFRRFFIFDIFDLLILIPGSIAIMYVLVNNSLRSIDKFFSPVLSGLIGYILPSTFIITIAHTQIHIFQDPIKNQYFKEKIQTIIQLVIKPIGISQTTRIASLSRKNNGFVQTPFYSSFIFYTIPHINFRISPPPFINNVFYNYLRQFLEANLSVCTYPVFYNIKQEGGI